MCHKYGTLCMDKQDSVVYIGEKFTVEWYFDINGYSQPFEHFDKTSDIQKRKFLMLVKRIADYGKIYDITKFRNEGSEIYAFKPQPDRYLSFFVKSKKILISHAFVKKSDKLPKSEKEKALKRRDDFLKRFGLEA